MYKWTKWKVASSLRFHCDGVHHGAASDYSLIKLYLAARQNRTWHTVLSLCHFVNQGLVAVTLGQTELWLCSALPVLQAPISRRSATCSSLSRATAFFTAALDSLGDWLDLNLVELDLPLFKMRSYQQVKWSNYIDFYRILPLGVSYVLLGSNLVHFKMAQLGPRQTRRLSKRFQPLSWLKRIKINA